MTPYTFGFIGCGCMAKALAVSSSKKVKSIIISNRTVSKAIQLSNIINACVSSNKEVASSSKFIFLGVKPQDAHNMLKEISPILKGRKDRFILVSMMAGLSVHDIQNMANGEYPVIRIMPNTATAIGNGVILYHKSINAYDAEINEFIDYMSECGRLYEISEDLFDAGSAVSGCAPAFAYMFIEYLAKAGESLQLEGSDALNYACYTVLGAARMIIESGVSPLKLRDDVCSKGGATIEGVKVLESRGMQSIVTDAVLASYSKMKNIC